MTSLDPSTVPADDRGLLLGDGLFETLRLYGGRPFRLDRHLSRLESGARTFGIPVPTALRDRVAAAVADWVGRDAVLRITLTRGSGLGLLPSEEADPRLIVWVRALGPGSTEEEAPMRARLFGRLDEHSLVSGFKTIGYLERIQALRLARMDGADEALLRNSRGLIVEGTASNVMAVRGKTLVAPGRAEGALPGITREALLQLAPAADLAVEERGISEEDLEECSELFLSSSVREIAPIGEVEGTPVGSGGKGPVQGILAREFRKTVRAETGS